MDRGGAGMRVREVPRYPPSSHSCSADLTFVSGERRSDGGCDRRESDKGSTP